MVKLIERRETWYAVQYEPTDAWDYGSNDYDEALDMLREQGEGLIAVIQDGYCDKELYYDDLFGNNWDLYEE